MSQHVAPYAEKESTRIEGRKSSKGYSIRLKPIEWYLDAADRFAVAHCGCKKVHVGCVLVNPKNGLILSSGVNRAIPNKCKSEECMRIQKYGEASKDHRLPSDCRAIHSEVDAICRCAVNTRGSYAYVTRYPCEACARALVAAGVRAVFYGRQQEISEEAKHIFASGNVRVHHINNWDREDTLL